MLSISSPTSDLIKEINHAISSELRYDDIAVEMVAKHLDAIYFRLRIPKIKNRTADALLAHDCSGLRSVLQVIQNYETNEILVQHALNILLEVTGLRSRNNDDSLFCRKLLDLNAQKIVKSAMSHNDFWVGVKGKKLDVCLCKEEDKVIMKDLHLIEMALNGDDVSLGELHLIRTDDDT